MDVSSAELLRVNAARDRALIESGQRPMYHLHATTTPDGTTVDVMVQELPIVHQFVPDEAGVALGGRLLIARTLGVDPDAFDVTAGELPRPSRTSANAFSCQLRIG